MSELRNLYNRKYIDEKWMPIELKPDAMHTNAYDDVYRLLKKHCVTASILEIGCGSGRLAMALGEKGYNVTGYDLSDIRIKLANEVLDRRYPALKDRVKFISGDVDDPIPGNKEEFDVSLLCAVLEHVPDVFHLLRQCHKLTRTNGYIIVSVPNAAYLKHIFALLSDRVPVTGTPNRDMQYWEDNGWDGAHFHYFTKTELRRALEHVGFQPLHWTSDGKFAKLRRWSRRLSGELTVIAQKKYNPSSIILP